jgi:hypothetical protein
MINFQDFIQIITIINDGYNVDCRIILTDNGSMRSLCLSKGDRIFILRINMGNLKDGRLFHMVGEYTHIFAKMFYDGSFEDLPKQTYIYFKFIK